MRPIAVVVLCVAAGAGCKGMGGLARGFGHVASGFGKVAGVAAKGISHAAPAIVHVAHGVGVTAAHVAVHAEPVVETTIEAAAVTHALAPDPCNACPLELQCAECAGIDGRACEAGFDAAGIATCVTPY
ncbi:MAG TPA: hypothetical protein VMJ10_36585 [Kofleriaceae bacterium]|nr:hypothetical protein [Kofleriaceae bacterium]